MDEQRTREQSRGFTREDLQRDTMRPAVLSYDEPQPLTGRGSNPTDEVLGRVGDAMNAAMASTEAPRAPKIELLEQDGEAIRRFDADGPFEATLMLKARDGRGPDWLSGEEIPVVLTFTFPNADIARDHLRPIGHAVELLNDTFARAFAARTEDVPDAARCRHHVILERFRRALPMQATCDRCLTVLVHDVGAWLDENGYSHLAEGPHVVDRETAASIIQDAANRVR